MTRFLKIPVTALLTLVWDIFSMKDSLYRGWYKMKETEASCLGVWLRNFYLAVAGIHWQGLLWKVLLPDTCQCKNDFGSQDKKILLCHLSLWGPNYCFFHIYVPLFPYLCNVSEMGKLHLPHFIHHIIQGQRLIPRFSKSLRHIHLTDMRRKLKKNSTYMNYFIYHSDNPCRWSYHQVLTKLVTTDI